MASGMTETAVLALQRKVDPRGGLLCCFPETFRTEARQCDSHQVFMVHCRYQDSLGYLRRSQGHTRLTLRRSSLRTSQSIRIPLTVREPALIHPAQKGRCMCSVRNAPTDLELPRLLQRSCMVLEFKLIFSSIIDRPT